MNRRECLKKGIKIGGGSVLGYLGLSSSGCEPEKIRPTDDRAALYWERQEGIKDTLKRVDPGQAAVYEAIMRAAEKFQKAMELEYLPADPAREGFKPKGTTKKQTLAVIEIYCVDQEGEKVAENLLTEYLVSCFMSNPRMGENFDFAERYKLSTVMTECNLTKMSDFDPKYANKNPLFAGTNVLVTASMYPSQDKVEMDSAGNSGRVSYRGGIELLMKGTDVTKSITISTSVEHINWTPALAKWIETGLRKR